MNRTIVALATPPGISGLAVIRVSGEDAFILVDTIFTGKKKLSECSTHTIHYGHIVFNDKLIDSVTASIFRAPNSYTGENVVEIGCHGGNLVSQEIIESIISHGAYLAEPGDFTKRAFLNGKLDLTQVEAVADIIHSLSIPGTQTAARQLNGEFTNRIKLLRKQLLDVASLLELELDFADEDIEFIDRNNIINKITETRTYCLELADSYKSAEILRSGYFVGIVGYPNSGKSTLFNTLLQRKRAIVSDIPGTTRDYLEEVIYLSGIPIKLFDTAGIRETDDIIEIEGIKMVESLLGQSNMLLVINDFTITAENSNLLTDSLKSRFHDTDILILQNKIDKFDSTPNKTDNNNELYISAKNQTGIEELKKNIESKANASVERVKDILVNKRQATLLYQAADYLKSALIAIQNNLDNELISIEIRNTSSMLGEITGAKWSEDVLNNIFSNFCIGK